MGRFPCCDDEGLKKGPWTQEEDEKLVDYIEKHGAGCWRALPKLAGLNRCGKSCRLRWTNYLRPDIKRGRFSEEEERLIIHLHSHHGNKWSAMAACLPGRTDNEIKNYWNTHLKKKLLRAGVDPVTHRPLADLAIVANMLGAPNLGNLGPSPWCRGTDLRVQADAVQLARFYLLQTVVRDIIANCSPNELGSPTLLSLLPSSNTDLVSLMPSTFLSVPFVDGSLETIVQGIAPDAMGLSSMAAITHGLYDSLGKGGLLSQADMSASKASAVDNCGMVDHQLLVSYNTKTTAPSTTSVASASPEQVSMDHSQEMMNGGVNVSDSLLTAALEPWRDISEVDSDSYWKDILV